MCNTVLIPVSLATDSEPIGLDKKTKTDGVLAKESALEFEQDICKEIISNKQRRCCYFNTVHRSVLLDEVCQAM